MTNNKEKQKKRIKEKILSYLIHYPKASFSDIYDSNRKIPSNDFTYYLNKLIEEGYVEKNKNKKYFLTIKGKHLESDIDDVTGKKRKKPFVAVLMVIKKKW
jgi:predicted transcriptional regulator